MVGGSKHFLKRETTLSVFATRKWQSVETTNSYLCNICQPSVLDLGTEACGVYQVMFILLPPISIPVTDQHESC